MKEMFPILGVWKWIPWAIIEPHRAQAEKNHYQTLERLEERGGLSWSELLAVLEDRPWSQMDEVESEQKVLKLISHHCIVCGKPLILGRFAYNQTMCWDCFKMKVDSICEEIQSKSDEELIKWMEAAIAEQFGEKR